MSRRTKEGDVLQKMGATLNKVITQGSDSSRFGTAASSAGFMSQQSALGIATMTGVEEYTKVSRIMAAVRDHITTYGGRQSVEKVTEKYNQFVLLVYDDLELNDLAQMLVDNLRKVKPEYVSPLPDDAQQNDGNRDKPSGGEHNEASKANGALKQANEANGALKQANDSSTSATSVTLPELLRYLKLSQEALEARCSEEHLRDIARKMGDWEYHASYLGLSTADIDDLKEEFKKTGVKKERMLFLWKQRAVFKATYRYLVEDVFLKCGNAEMAEFVCKLLK